MNISCFRVSCVGVLCFVALVGGGVTGCSSMAFDDEANETTSAASTADAGADANGADASICGSGTFEVTAESAPWGYTINGEYGAWLDVCRGRTYTFHLSTVGHPFWIQADPPASAGSTLSGITRNGSVDGELTWTVADDAPDHVLYKCQFHGAMTGQIRIH
jgi:hypothetical protein